MRPESTPPVTDSPWFWVYLFASIALIGLLIIQPKFQQRQSFIERTGEARRTTMSTVGEAERPKSARLSDSATIPAANTTLQTVSLRPIILILAGAVAIGWVLFYIQRKAARQKVVNESRQQ